MFRLRLVVLEQSHCSGKWFYRIYIYECVLYISTWIYLIYIYICIFPFEENSTRVVIKLCNLQQINDSSGVSIAQQYLVATYMPVTLHAIGNSQPLSQSYQSKKFTSDLYWTKYTDQQLLCDHKSSSSTCILNWHTGTSTRLMVFKQLKHPGALIVVEICNLYFIRSCKYLPRQQNGAIWQLLTQL